MRSTVDPQEPGCRERGRDTEERSTQAALGAPSLQCGQDDGGQQCQAAKAGGQGAARLQAGQQGLGPAESQDKAGQNRLGAGELAKPRPPQGRSKQKRTKPSTARHPTWSDMQRGLHARLRAGQQSRSAAQQQQARHERKEKQRHQASGQGPARGQRLCQPSSQACAQSFHGGTRRQTNLNFPMRP